MNMFGWTISQHELLLGLLALSAPVFITVVCAIAMGREKEMVAVLLIVAIVLCLSAAR